MPGIREPPTKYFTGAISPGRKLPNMRCNIRRIEMSSRRSVGVKLGGPAGRIKHQIVSSCGLIDRSISLKPADAMLSPKVTRERSSKADSRAGTIAGLDQSSSCTGVLASVTWLRGLRGATLSLVTAERKLSHFRARFACRD